MDYIVSINWMEWFHSITQMENDMKRKTCMFCFYPAAYVSRNSSLALCEDCYISASDDFESSMADEVGLSFDEYYEIEEIDSDC